MLAASLLPILSVCAGSALLYQATTLPATLSLRLRLGSGAAGQEFPEKADIFPKSQCPRGVERGCVLADEYSPFVAY